VGEGADGDGDHVGGAVAARVRRLADPPPAGRRLRRGLALATLTLTLTIVAVSMLVLALAVAGI
jgi:hypothetical protein